MSPKSWLKQCLCVASAALVVLAAQAVSAQESTIIRGCVSGKAGEAVSRANISVMGALFQTRTADDGCFAIALPAGEWRLVVRRLGYLPTEVVARAEGLAQPDLSIILERATTELGRLVVNGDVLSPFTSTITPMALRQLPPLGERDAFRALPFLPGVAQPNDILGRFYLAGGASDEHAITLNGHPLQAPFHLNSVVGAFNPASLDRVDVVMHHLPVAAFDRVSGTIDLHTRNAVDRSEREAQLSVLSLSGTASEPELVGNTDVLATARASYLSGVLARLDLDGASDDLQIPSFRDAVVTARTQWARGWDSEVLLFHTQDSWPESSRRDNVPATWGENLVGLRVGYQDGAWSGGARISVNRATVDQRSFAIPDQFGSVNANLFNSASQPRLTSLIDIDQRWLSAQVHARYQRAQWSLFAAMGLDAREHDNAWLGETARERLFEQLPLSARYVASQSAATALLEGTTIAAGSGLRSTLGLRTTSVGGALYVAPRATVSAPVAKELTLSLGVDRRFQFDAIAGEPIEGSLTQPVFFPAKPRTADVAAVTAAWRPSRKGAGTRAQLSVSFFGKRNRNRPVLETRTAADNATPTDVSIGPPQEWQPAFTFVNGFALGATVGFDLVAEGGWLLQGSYTRQRSRDERDGDMRATPWDAPHQLAGLLGVPLGQKWQITLAGQFRSGPAVTPINLTVLNPFFDGYFPRYIPGELRSARAPSFFRADIGVQRQWTARGATWILSAQAINALANDNGVRYDGVTAASCSGRSQGCASNGGTRGLPFLPSVGLEVRW